MKELWTLDPSIVFLNHGSFGAAPARVLELQSELRARMERNPMQFFLRELEDRIDEARAGLGAFVSAALEDLVFVPNATTGINAVLRSLHFSPGDELLTTDQEYNASKNALEFAAARDGARVVVANIPFPLASEGEVVDAIVSRVTPRTRLLLVDHVTSPTGLVFPVARIASAMAERGIDVLVDGAHAPGMVELSFKELEPYVTYYAANCHKWLCTPKGAAFLWVRRDKQSQMRPTVISHGANSPRTDRARWLIEFDWMGTVDPTAMLCIPASIDFLTRLAPDFRQRNRALALEARKILCDALELAPPAPESMIGSLATVPLPDASSPAPGADGRRGAHPPGGLADPLQEALLHEHRIEVPVFSWPAPPKRLLRISAQLYNTRGEYELLARALLNELR